jgi:hypothetical protein
MRRLHLVVGIITVTAFLLSGQLMDHHAPPLSELGDSTRLLYRSRHLYILAGGLVNLMIGLYLQRPSSRWRAATQTVGSTMLLVSPVLQTVGFLVEPQAGFKEQMWWSSGGLYLLFGGCMAHAASAFRNPV